MNRLFNFLHYNICLHNNNSKSRANEILYFENMKTVEYVPTIVPTREREQREKTQTYFSTQSFVCSLISYILKKIYSKKNKIYIVLVYIMLMFSSSSSSQLKDIAEKGKITPGKVPKIEDKTYDKKILTMVNKID